MAAPSPLLPAHGSASGGLALIESVAAFLRALRLYLAIGLVASAVNAVAVHPPTGETRLERAAAVVEDVLVWPRFLVQAAGAVDGRLASLPRESQPVLYMLLRRALYGPEASAPNGRGSSHGRTAPDFDLWAGATPRAAG